MATSNRILKRFPRGPLARYLLPFLSVGAALGIQLAASWILPKGVNVPFVPLYLAAMFVAAWFGGYIPGAMACFLTLVGLPFAMTPGFRWTSNVSSQLTLVLILSLVISLVAQTRRRKREVQSLADELDRRVQARTQELAKAVEALESEIVQHKRTEQALRESEKRVDLALDAAGIGRWDVDLSTGKVDHSARHGQILAAASVLSSMDTSAQDNLFEY